MNNTLTAIRGFEVGQAQDTEAMTGCSVILCPPGTIGGVDQRGGAPATRETDLLHPLHTVQEVNAILLTGGSAYGLAAADGVMRYLEEKKIGFATPEGPVPIVPAAALYDLNIGRPDRRPDATMGYSACQAASSEPVVQGVVGAGAGAKVGSMMGAAFWTKSGIGSAVMDIGNGVQIAALLAVNAIGDVVDDQGQIIAGLRIAPESTEYIGTLNMLKMMGSNFVAGANTMIGVIATNAKLNKEQTNKLAQMAQDGVAQAIRPAHTMYDGDTLFALASCEIEADFNVVSAFAAEVVAVAIRNAVRATLGRE